MDPKFLTRVVASLLLSQVAFAGLPPTSTRVSGDTSDITTFVFRFPNFTGTHTGTIMSLGVNSIAGGGTGQTTALGARLALLPSLTGHAGEVLTVNPGETDLVYTPAGSGTVTSVDVIDSTGVLSPTGGPITTSGSIDLPFTHVGGSVAFLSPLGGSIGAPLFRLIDLSDLPTIPPNKITGADPFTFAGYNSAGTLDLVPGWSFENGSSALRAYNAKDVTALGGFTFTNLDAASEQTADSTQNIYSFNLDSHFDRNHTDTNLAGVYTGLNMSHRSEGAGSIDTLIGANLQTQLGNGTGGHANQMTGALIGLNPSLNTTVDYAQGLNVSINGDPTSLVTHGDGIFVGNYTKFSENFNLLSLFNQNTGTIGGDYRAVAMSNNADVGGFSANTIGFDTNNITKGATGFGYFHTGNVGDGSGVGFNLVDGNQNNGTVDASGNIFNFNTNSVWNQGFNGLNLNLGGGSAEFKGDVNMVNLFNNAILTGNNTLRAMAFTNNSDGYRVVAGISAFTSGNMSEEIRGSLYNLAGNSRTKTGIDLSLTGAATDDATGLRVNVNNQTSSTQHVHSGTFEGGLFSVQGDFTPFNGAAVEIGNGFSMGSTIQSGSPLTGTDQIIQLIQSNLIVQDDIATGPFGLDTNMLGMTSQVAVDPGKTVPLLRSLLLGTTVPQGSGGTITEHVALEILGLPSFGGSVSNPTRTAIQDSTLLGQNFCGGAGAATDCWWMRVRDASAETSLPKLAIGTASQKVADSTVKLELNDGHVRYSQTTVPVATPNANAGTGATCVLDTGSTDLIGGVTLVTGALPYAPGEQCSIAFNAAFTGRVHCQLTPRSDTAALGSLNVRTNPASSALGLNFVSPETTPTTYEWDYSCAETS
jgi:hypothetical protein